MGGYKACFSGWKRVLRCLSAYLSFYRHAGVCFTTRKSLPHACITLTQKVFVRRASALLVVLITVFTC